MLWTMNNFELHFFADSIFNGKENVINYIKKFNAESQLPNDCEFSTLWGRAIELDITKMSINFRDFSLPYLIASDLHYWGTLIGAEQLTGLHYFYYIFNYFIIYYKIFCYKKNTI